SSFTWPFPKLSTTRMHGLLAVRSRSSSSSATCHGSRNRGDPRPQRLKLLSVVWVPKTLTKIFSPAVWKRGEFANATQQVLIRGISAIKIHDVGDRNVVLISFKQLH